jgi:5-methylcytosine-specific restriction protein A
MTETLNALRPVEHLRVMDLVAKAGLDISDWENFEGGPSKAASNPKYCYQWAFVQPGRAVVVNLWHADMIQTGADISVSFTLHGRDDLTGPRRARAERLLAAIAEASAQRVPLRVIVNEGTISHAKDGSSSSDKTRVESRFLDEMPWRVEFCDPTSGACVLRRGPATGMTVDQFSVVIDGDGPERRATASWSFPRDAALRQRALDRASGRCEYCGCTGFVMLSGSVFLETHHVVPLSEGGLDRSDNIVAICANDHRGAHLGSRSNEMRRDMLAYLAKIGMRSTTSG